MCCATSLQLPYGRGCSQHKPCAYVVTGLVASPAWLRAVKSSAHSAGALLVFDEIQTFRLGYGGAQEVCCPPGLRRFFSNRPICRYSPDPC